MFLLTLCTFNFLSIIGISYRPSLQYFEYHYFGVKMLASFNNMTLRSNKANVDIRKQWYSIKGCKGLKRNSGVKILQNMNYSIAQKILSFLPFPTSRPSRHFSLLLIKKNKRCYRFLFATATEKLKRLRSFFTRAKTPVCLC